MTLSFIASTIYKELEDLLCTDEITNKKYHKQYENVIEEISKILHIMLAMNETERELNSSQKKQDVL